MIKCLVFSGGAYKGFSFLGVLKYFEENKICSDIKSYYGTSAGAIFSALISIGYSYNELYYCVNKINIDQLIDLSQININYFLENYGLINPTKLYNLVDLLIEKKTKVKNITFIQLYEKYHKNLIITGSNISKVKLELFNYKTTPYMTIMDAIRISTCIPIIFKPIQYNNSFYVDGALYNNYPIDIATNEYNINEILGVQILFTNNFNNDIECLEDYLKKLIINVMTVFNINQLVNNSTIYITTCIGDMLNLNTNDLTEIINVGYEAIKNYYINNSHKFHRINIKLKTIDYNNIIYK